MISPMVYLIRSSAGTRLLTANDLDEEQGPLCPALQRLADSRKEADDD